MNVTALSSSSSNRTTILNRSLDMAAASLLEALPGPSAILDAEGNIQSVNEDWRQFGRENKATSGFQETYGVGYNYLSICASASGSCSTGADPVRSGIADVLSGKARSFEYEYPCHDDKAPRWYKCLVRPINDSADGRRQALIQHVDVTDQVLSHAGENAPCTPLQRFADHGLTRVWKLCVTKKQLQIDPKTAVLWGLAGEPKLQLGDLFSRVHPEDVGPLSELIAVLTQGITRSASADARIKDRYGEYRTYVLLAQRRFGEDSTPAPAIDLLAFDHSDQWHTEQSLSHFDAQMRRFLEDAPVRVARLDTNFRYLHANKAFHKSMGLLEQDIIGKHFKDVMGPDAWASIGDYLAQAMNGQTASCEATFTTPRGQELSALVTYVPVEWVPGEIAGIYSIVHDTTELKKREEQLRAASNRAEAANHAKSAFLASVSHELRTPLNAIVGFSDMMADHYMGSAGIDRYREYAGYIQSSARHLLSMVNDILDLSAIESGREELNLEPVSLEDAVQEAIRTVQAKYGAQKHTYQYFPATPMTLHADKRAIHQILLNLLSNSAKFTNSGGRITVSSWTENSSIFVQVSDTGCGIDLDRLNDVLQPYVTTGSDQVSTKKGWGLGLSVVKSLVSRHGGDVSIESDGISGTEVTFSIPQQMIS